MSCFDLCFRSDKGLQAQYLHTDFGNPTLVGADCSYWLKPYSIMLTTRKTQFCVQQSLGKQLIRLTLDCGDLLIFKGDLVHSGGASDEENFRFFSYCPTKISQPEWWNVHKMETLIPAANAIREETVTKKNLRIITNPASSTFSHTAYMKYLFCSVTNKFFHFDIDAYFHGIHTHNATDSVKYDGNFMNLNTFDTLYKTTAKHCIHFPSNQQIMVDFPEMTCAIVAHWRTKCACRRKNRKRGRQHNAKHE